MSSTGLCKNVPDSSPEEGNLQQSALSHFFAADSLLLSRRKINLPVTFKQIIHSLHPLLYVSGHGVIMCSYFYLPY